jgi:hypothetical protein
MLNRRFLSRCILAAIALIVSSFVAAYADLGPKPTMDFKFAYNVPGVEAKGGQLLMSNNPDCADAKPLQDLGPQRFSVSKTGAYALAYGFGQYRKLVIDFSDKTRESNIFQSANMAPKFTVLVNPNDLVVTEDTPLLEPSKNFAIALATTLAIELAIGAIYVKVARRPRSVLLLIAIGNLISLPMVWFAFPLLPIPFLRSFIVSEVFAWLFEAAFLHFASRKAIPLRPAILLSLVMNLASMIAGLLNWTGGPF